MITICATIQRSNINYFFSVCENSIQEKYNTYIFLLSCPSIFRFFAMMRFFLKIL